MKTSGNLASEITMVNKNKDESRDVNAAANAGVLHGGGGGSEQDVSWEKPSWTQNAGLKQTGKGREISGCSTVSNESSVVQSSPVPSFRFVLRWMLLFSPFVLLQRKSGISVERRSKLLCVANCCFIIADIIFFWLPTTVTRWRTTETWQGPSHSQVSAVFFVCWLLSFRSD